MVPQASTMPDANCFDDRIENEPAGTRSKGKAAGARVKASSTKALLAKIRVRYWDDLAYLLGEFSKLEEQLGPGVSEDGDEDSRQKLARLQQFIAHLHATMAQLEPRSTAEGAPTTRQQARDLGNHIRDRLVPVKERLMVQMAANAAAAVAAAPGGARSPAVSASASVSASNASVTDLSELDGGNNPCRGAMCSPGSDDDDGDVGLDLDDLVAEDSADGSAGGCGAVTGGIDAPAAACRGGGDFVKPSAAAFDLRVDMDGRAAALGIEADEGMTSSTTCCTDDSDELFSVHGDEALQLQPAAVAPQLPAAPSAISPILVGDGVGRATSEGAGDADDERDGDDEDCTTSEDSDDESQPLAPRGQQHPLAMAEAGPAAVEPAVPAAAAVMAAGASATVAAAAPALLKSEVTVAAAAMPKQVAPVAAAASLAGVPPALVGMPVSAAPPLGTPISAAALAAWPTFSAAAASLATAAAPLKIELPEQPLTAPIPAGQGLASSAGLKRTLSAASGAAMKPPRVRKRQRSLMPALSQPRDVLYECAGCKAHYTAQIACNPWWALFQQQCPHCGVQQVPRVDITEPTNNVDTQTAILSACAEDDEASGSDYSSDEEDEGEESDAEEEGKRSNLSPEQGAKLLVMMAHARSCPGQHANPHHQELCRSTKFLMLHIRDCSGLASDGTSPCPHPWCRPCKALLMHLLNCPEPSSCKICSPVDLPAPLQHLRARSISAESTCAGACSGCCSSSH